MNHEIHLFFLFLLAIFSDSQCRLLVEGDLSFSSDWYVNSTPGGTFNNVACEIRTCELACKPQYVVLAVGTNDAGQHLQIGRAKLDFANLIATTEARFPGVKVCSVIFQYFLCIPHDMLMFS